MRVSNKIRSSACRRRQSVVVMSQIVDGRFLVQLVVSGPPALRRSYRSYRGQNAIYSTLRMFVSNVNRTFRLRTIKLECF